MTKRPRIVRVTLSFETDLDDLVKFLGDDYRETGEGMTVEGNAAALVHNHDAKYGYIHWRAVPAEGLIE